ncbi:hypothetical protein [Microbacterium sp. T32]|uniref:hypothetical protein n=1 Tax=Microbacterium sp. T32 TaxID=1776083 RepID=UPI0007AC26E3|nr:hypothetical protein [Microbacterium sp. T32]KZE41389.1 hypothetical protein AVW09_02035 [Microbacterium sp. T32]
MITTHTTPSAGSACHAWAHSYEHMWDMADRFHGALTLSEAVALADVLAAAGRGDLAASLIRGWGIGDPEMVEDHNDNQDDPHYIARLIYSYGDPISEYADGLPWLPPRAEVSGL